MRFLFLSLVLFLGCSAPSELGQECRLVKRDLDGGRQYITNAEIESGASKDFISLGSLDCEDLICVRSTGDARVGGPNESARGYCSKACNIGSACPSYSREVDSNPKTRLICRPLLLDAETLRALCNGSEADRAKCQTYFGGATSSDFCARESFSADAGH